MPTNPAVAEADDIQEIATIDSDFDIYRVNRRKMLKNIFPA